MTREELCLLIRRSAWKLIELSFIHLKWIIQNDTERTCTMWRRHFDTTSRIGGKNDDFASNKRSTSIVVETPSTFEDLVENFVQIIHNYAETITHLSRKMENTSFLSPSRLNAVDSSWFIVDGYFLSSRWQGLFGLLLSSELGLFFVSFKE